MTWGEILKYAVALGLDFGREALDSRKSKRAQAEMQAQAAALAAASAKASSDAVTRAAHSRCELCRHPGTGPACDDEWCARQGCCGHGGK